VTSFVETRKQSFGVEPICRAMGVATSTHYARRSRKPSARAVRDAELVALIGQVRTGYRRVYGARKTWRELRRRGVTDAGRERVARLMRSQGWQGVRRGGHKRTTIVDAAAERARDLVGRRFVATAPNQLWVADLTYVRTWHGFSYLAFILDVYSRRIVGWQIATHMRSDLVLDALEMAHGLRRPGRGQLVAHTDRGSQFTSIAYTERLAELGIAPSVGSRGDAYDNAMAEAWVATYKTECVQRRLYPSFEHAEHEALSWIGFYNNERLHEALGDVPPVEHEALTTPSAVSPVAQRRQATPSASNKEKSPEQDQQLTTPAGRHTVSWPSPQAPEPNEGTTK
jgi:putative transposase